MNNNLEINSNPLSYFEDFFPLGFDEAYKNFYKLPFEKTTRIAIPEMGDNEYSEVDNPSYIAECDKEKDIIIVEKLDYVLVDKKDSLGGSEFHGLPKGKTIEEKRTHVKRVFYTEIQAKLDTKIYEASKQINDGILQKNGEEVQKAYLKTILSNLAYIIENRIPTICQSKYIPQCQSLLIYFIQELDKRYSQYVVRDKSSFVKYLTPKSGNPSYSLHMIPRKYKDLNVLLDLLKEEGFVEPDLSLDLFQKAFDNTPIKKTLCIKWIKIDRGKTYLGSITELMKQLHDKGYISGYTDAQLSKIFVRVDGSSINETNWKSARNNTKVGKSGKRNKILYDIDYIIKNF